MRNAVLILASFLLMSCTLGDFEIKRTAKAKSSDAISADALVDAKKDVERKDAVNDGGIDTTDVPVSDTDTSDMKSDVRDVQVEAGIDVSDVMDIRDVHKETGVDARDVVTDTRDVIDSDTKNKDTNDTSDTGDTFYDTYTDSSDATDTMDAFDTDPCLSPAKKACGNKCVNTDTNANHCGGCGNPCPNPANTNTSCKSGNCQFTCKSGFADCNNDKRNDGCEVKTKDDLGNCGSCGNKCNLANVKKQSCFQGTCTVSKCKSGFRNCDNKNSNGCEVSISTIQNCGSCGNSCVPAPQNSGALCQGGSCQYVCAKGWADANNDLNQGQQGDGCEKRLVCQQFNVKNKKNCEQNTIYTSRGGGMAYDKTEVTCKQWCRAKSNGLVQKTYSCNCNNPTKKPVVNLPLKAAKTYCKKIGGKVPPPKEWETMAGNTTYPLPTGNSNPTCKDFVADVVCGGNNSIDLQPVCSRPNDKPQNGCDLGGNASELTTKPFGSAIITKGGSEKANKKERLKIRKDKPWIPPLRWLGFRCVYIKKP